MVTPPLRLHPSVERALAEGAPVVALESAIITHGMPTPANLETAMAVEDDIASTGATPATVAVIDGEIRIGLDRETLVAFAGRGDLRKLSRADLAACLAEGGSGSTTVAATMIAARLAGISVFATGGIGGVHRGAGESFDISADLTELAASPVTVVSAGPKAILDIPKTLETLETLGVPVIAVGQDNVPGFWSRRTGIEAPLRMDSAGAIARAHLMRGALGLPGGQLVVNPVPAADEIPPDRIDPVICDALDRAAEKGISAKALTPWLLDRILHATGGASLAANVALVRNNARLAAEIAREISGLNARGGPDARPRL